MRRTLKPLVRIASAVSCVTFAALPALAQVGMPYVPPELHSERRLLHGNTLSFCVWAVSPTVEVDKAVATAIEKGATAVVKFRILKDEARTKRIEWPRFSHPNYVAKVERNFIATMGMPVTPDGRQENGDLNLAARNAVLRMIELLEERGWSREQAYVLCSVAVDLKVSNVVDMPNATVSALLPEDIFR